MLQTLTSVTTIMLGALTKPGRWSRWIDGPWSNMTMTDKYRGDSLSEPNMHELCLTWVRGEGAEVCVGVSHSVRHLLDHHVSKHHGGLNTMSYHLDLIKT